MEKIQIFNYLIFLIIFNIFKEAASLVVLPFKTIENNDTSTPFNFNNPIYSDILVGNSEKILDVFFTSNMHSYYLDEDSCKGYNFYNNNISPNISTKDYILLEEDEKAIQINETLYLYKDLEMKKKIKIENFPIFIKISQLNSEKLCLLIGLLFRVSGPLKRISFFEELKKIKLIDSYSWTIKYTSENEGLLIIGEEPHIYDPNNYNKNYMRTLNPSILENAYSWTINFHKIYSGKNLISQNNFCIISHGNNYIMGNKEYNKSIVDELFGKYLKSEICHYHHDHLFQSYYYCDKTKLSQEDIKSFPSLSFINVDLGEKFVIEGEELFFEKNGKYYFKVYFNDFSQGSWLIGKLFLKKYQFIFDHDKKVISYYKTSDENYDDNFEEGSNDDKLPSGDNSNKNNYLIYIVILLSILFMIIIILLIKFYFINLYSNKHRKKLVNELVDEDNAEYHEIENKNKNKDILVDMSF